MEKDSPECKQSSSMSPSAAASIKIRTVKVFEVKDIKIPNFSTRGKHRPESETVCNLEEEKRDFGSYEAQWSEPLFDLVVHPNGSGSSGSENYVSAMVHKLWFSPSYVGFLTRDSLNCTVSVVDVNGTTRFLQSFGAEDFLTRDWCCDNFNLKDVGLNRFISRATLLSNADELLPSDVLTVRYEVLFRFDVRESSGSLCAAVNDPSLSDASIDSVRWRSAASMVDGALDALNHLLHLQDELKGVFAEGFDSHSGHGGEMLQPVSDGWEKCLESLYRSVTGRSNACSHGGWNKRMNVKASSDKLLESWKVSAEIRRICNRMVCLAKIRLFNFQVLGCSLGLWKEPIEFKKVKTFDSVKQLFETRELLESLANSSVESPRYLNTLFQTTMLNLFMIIEITSTVPDSVCIVSSLLDNSLFISNPFAISDGEARNEQADDLVIKEEKKDFENEFCVGEVSQTMEDSVEANCGWKVETKEKAILVAKAQTQSIKTPTLRRVMNEPLKSSFCKIATKSFDMETRLHETHLEVVPSRMINKSTTEARSEEFHTSGEINTSSAEERSEEFHVSKLIDSSTVEARPEGFSASKAIDNSTVKARPEEFHASKVINTSSAEERSEEFHSSKLIDNSTVEASPEGFSASKAIDKSKALDLWVLTSQNRDINGHLSQGRSLVVLGSHLRRCSEFFSKLMETPLKEQLCRQITLDVDSETLELFVGYLQTGKLVNDENLDLQLLYKFAHMYGIEKLVEICSERLAGNISLYNSRVLRDFSTLYQNDMLKEKVKEFQNQCAGMWNKCENPITGASTSATSSEPLDGEEENPIEEYYFYQ